MSQGRDATHIGFFSLSRRGQGNGGEGFIKVGLGEEEGGGAEIRM